MLTDREERFGQIEAVGFGGGIWILWNIDEIKLRINFVEKLAKNWDYHRDLPVALD